MTPSSSMHGLSLINCGIGLPKLKAAYSSRNASRCSKLTISSSASFISSGNNSMPAFRSSLLRRLCNTLLTLACTRTKRAQPEKRFGSSLHTSQVLLLFGAASFWRLYVTRVAEAFAPSFLFEVFISGISLGLFGASIFDHLLESFVNQSGPFHHIEHSAKPEGVAPLVHKSAGFSSVETCCHCDGSVNICIWNNSVRYKGSLQRVGSLFRALESTIGHPYCRNKTSRSALVLPGPSTRTVLSAGQESRPWVPV